MSLFKKVKVYSVPTDHYGFYRSVYELIDLDSKKIRYAIIDDKKRGKKIKVLDDEFEDGYTYTLRQIKKEEFLELKIKALEDELHEEKLLRWRFERYNNEKKDLIKEIKSYASHNDILSIKELFLEDLEEEELQQEEEAV